MRIAIVKATISRNKLEQGIYKPDEQEIIGYEMDEEKYYKPVAEFLHSKLKEAKAIV